MDDLLNQRLNVAIDIAKKAGKFALEKSKNNNFTVSEKQENDFVTTADKETEQLIYSELKKAFPCDGFLGEESDEILGEGRWVVDPIDGTTNYFRNLANWAVSIAFEKEIGNPIIGVVYAPVFDDIFYAAKGLGAYQNGKKIQVSSINDIKYSINVCVPPHRYKEVYKDYVKKSHYIGKHCSDIRSYGSCALELCYIANGSIDGYYELFLGYYDFAAGKVILDEAGGKFYFEKAKIEEKYNLVATNFELFNWFEEHILKNEVK
ncbi:MAG: inositol monophosphatase family protein [Pleomorphochaeta sp.]